MKNKLLTNSLQEAMLVLKSQGYEEDPSLRFVKLEEDFTMTEARVFKTANGGVSVWFTEQPLGDFR